MLQKDLGTALLYYGVMLVLLYAATGSLPLVGVGLAGGAGAAVAPQSRAQAPDAAGEAIEALMALGYQSSEAARAVSSLSPLPDTADEIIRQALKSML